MRKFIKLHACLMIRALFWIFPSALFQRMFFSFATMVIFHHDAYQAPQADAKGWVPLGGAAASLPGSEGGAGSALSAWVDSQAWPAPSPGRMGAERWERPARGSGRRGGAVPSLLELQAGEGRAPSVPPHFNSSYLGALPGELTGSRKTPEGLFMCFSHRLSQPP